MAAEESPVRIYQTINLGGSSQHCQDRIGIDFLPSSKKVVRKAAKYSLPVFSNRLWKGNRESQPVWSPLIQWTSNALVCPIFCRGLWTCYGRPGAGGRHVLLSLTDESLLPCPSSVRPYRPCLRDAISGFHFHRC